MDLRTESTGRVLWDCEGPPGSDYGATCWLVIWRDFFIYTIATLMIYALSLQVGYCGTVRVLLGQTMGRRVLIGYLA